MPAHPTHPRPGCQPLAGAPLVPGPAGAARLPAAPGATVYAVAPGLVTGTEPLVIRTDDGRSYRYDGARGLLPQGERVTVGQPVAALEPGPPGDARTPCLTLRVVDAQDRPVDAYVLFAGLPGPAEHGSWAAGADPDLLGTAAYQVPPTPPRGPADRGAAVPAGGPGPVPFPAVAPPGPPGGPDPAGVPATVPGPPDVAEDRHGTAGDADEDPDDDPWPGLALLRPGPRAPAAPRGTGEPPAGTRAAASAPGAGAGERPRAATAVPDPGAAAPAPPPAPGGAAGGTGAAGGDDDEPREGDNEHVPAAGTDAAAALLLVRPRPAGAAPEDAR